jgi:2-methylfumaryl-CoA isomerase
VSVLGIEAEIAALETKHGVSFAKDEGLRFTHRSDIFPLVEGKVRTWGWTDLDAAFAAAGCCYGPYQTMLEAARDPRLVTENPMFETADNPSGERYPAAGAFATIPQMQRQPVRPAPSLGADSDAVLAQLLNLSPEALQALKAQGLLS